MAERPLIAANQITLMFFLFFKERDPIIDWVLRQADKVFEHEKNTDIVSDVRSIDDNDLTVKEAQIDENIDLKAAATTRLKTEDQVEEHQLARSFESDSSYDEALDLSLRYRFALARIDLLGQVIRSFSGNLDGPKKREILDSVFRLGLRSLHVLLAALQPVSQAIITHSETIEDQGSRRELEQLVRRVIAFLAQLYCDSTLLHLSRAVGVSDIEESYEAAIAQLGDNCATQLLELSIKLDHSESFPFALLKTRKARVSQESKVASQVLADLVARHTSIIPLKRETLKRIAQMLKLDARVLLESNAKA